MFMVCYQAEFNNEVKLFWDSEKRRFIKSKSKASEFDTFSQANLIKEQLVSEMSSLMKCFYVEKIMTF